MTESSVRALAERLRSQNAGREAERLALKWKAMSKNAFVFLRGTAALFYERANAGGLLPEGPRAWVCGDLHLENYGTFVSGDGIDGHIVFDVNDFDEAALAPYGFDILRLATSVLVAADSIGLPASQARESTHRLVTHYLAELAAGRPRTLGSHTARGPVRALMQDLQHRNPASFLDKRIQIKAGKLVLKTDGDKALPLHDAAKLPIGETLRALAPPDRHPRAFAFLDAARRIAGTGSLGIARNVVLTEGQGIPEAPWLIDLKAALPSSLLPYAGPQPSWPSEAERVVGIQLMFQAEPPALLRSVSVAGEPYIMKQLQPSADKLDLDQVAKDRDELADVIDVMAHLAAWGHLRASGKKGAAPAAELIAAGNGIGAVEDIEKRATELAAVTKADFQSYRKARDAGLI